MTTHLLLLLLALAFSPARAEEMWPSLSTPAPSAGNGADDAAVLIGVQGYAFVPAVPGAESNAKLWHEYLTRTRGVPPQNVKLLTGIDATREEILDAARQAAERAGKTGTLWFVFIGHGAPSADGQDGLLIAVDAQQKATSLQSHSVRRAEVLKILGASKASSIAVVLDACFSGRGPDGATIAPGLQPLVAVAAAGGIDPRMAVLTAARGDQFAGPLPGSNRPAFSYLVLGGLRGWAAAGKDARVTAGDLWKYAKDALDSTLRGRSQTPDLLGRESVAFGASAGEKGPDLAKLAQATAGGGAREEMFKISDLSQVPKAQAPAVMTSASVGADFHDLDVEALKKYNEAAVVDKGRSPAAVKAAKWRELAKAVPKYAEEAASRAEKWDAFEEARLKRLETRDKDWAKLSALLAMDVVSAGDKTRWATSFIEAYGRTSEENPYAAKLAAHLPPGAVKIAPVGIQWVTIPAGSFIMGSDDRGSSPRHKVDIKAFQLAKTEVTEGQYRKCVEAGACTDLKLLLEKDDSQGDDYPVVGVTWGQARAFSEWVGGRLPTEAQWEYAARSGGKEQKYPWGNEDATCERAVIDDCKGRALPVCSKDGDLTVHGVCDMAGNVREWVQDKFHDGYVNAPTDGSSWETEAYSRVYRGGSSRFDTAFALVSNRHWAREDQADSDLGFRPARWIAPAGGKPKRPTSTSR